VYTSSYNFHLTEDYSFIFIGPLQTLNIIIKAIAFTSSPFLIITYKYKKTKKEEEEEEEEYSMVA
jgi:hypothetical protein